MKADKSTLYNIILIIFLGFNITLIKAQSYNVCFVGSGLTTVIDSVKTENLTKNIVLTISGNDTLHLIGHNAINNINKDEFICLSPNPSTNNTILSFKLSEENNVIISVYNFEGKKVLHVNNFLQKGKHTYQLSGLNEGIYFIKVDADNISYITKYISMLPTNYYNGNIEYQGSETNNTLHSHYKSSKALLNMPYQLGDTIRYKGYSGALSDSIDDIPSENNTITFSFGSIPEIITNSISDRTSISALCGGNIIYNGGAFISQRGVCWSTSANPDINDSITIDGSGDGNFTSIITHLTPNTTYYVRAYATNILGTAYGNQQQFTTLSLATVTTDTATSVSDTSAYTGGNVLSDGLAAVTQKGICWGLSTNPTTADSITINGSGTGSFVVSLNNLNENTTYYVRAYAINSIGTAYGNEISFTTYALPSITTDTATSVTVNSAITGGNITFDGNTPILQRGICWSLSPNPTINDSITTNGSGTGTFISNLTALNDDTTYYIRAYAINRVGIAYGGELSFTTGNGIIILETLPLDTLTIHYALSGGNIISDGGSFVTERGVCFSGGPNPVYDHCTSDSSGTGIYASTVTGFSPDDFYYVRAYATNSYGTFYGNEIWFRAFASPRLSTVDAYDILGDTAWSGGIILDSGRTNILVKGICWSTSMGPSYPYGVYTLSFNEPMHGLLPNTLYYYRSFANNVVGTTYGELKSFNSGYIEGTSYQGGLVFYNDGTGHGLVCSTGNVSEGTSWGCEGTVIGGTSANFGTGQANTNAILSQCSTAGIAAKLCDDFVVNTYIDWYLPSRIELYYMYKALLFCNISNLNGNTYWSSTEYNNIFARVVTFFNNGMYYADYKRGTYKVRAVRNF